MLKRITSIILSIVLVASVCPVYSAAEESNTSDTDGSLNMFDIERTSYGVLDPDVVATKFSDGDNYEIVYPKNTILGENYESYDSPCVIIAEAYDEGLHKYYLVSTKRIVKTYLADEKPNLYAVSDDDALNGIYRIFNPETKLYDIYNATTDTYYEYGLDSVYEIDHNGGYGEKEYWEDCYVVKKGDNYGILGKKGEMLYEPYYYDITYYENCALGAVKLSDANGYSYTDYAILANNGSTDGKKLYDGFVSNDDNEIYASKIGSYGPYALVDINTLKVYTDYIYSSVKEMEVGGKRYLLCNASYKHDDKNCSYQEIISADGVWNSLTETGGYNTSIDWAEGYDSFKVVSYNDKTRYNSIYTLGGTCLYSGSTTYEEYFKDPTFDDTFAYINMNKVTRKYDKNRYYYSIYNSSNQLIAENLNEPQIYGDCIYTKRADTGAAFLYNYIKGEVVFDEAIEFINFRYNYNGKSLEEYTNAFFVENSEGMRGIYNLENNEFSGFIFTADQLNNMSQNIISNGSRKLWIFADSNGSYSYVNEDFKIILNSSNNIIKSEDNLLESVSYVDSLSNQVRIYDYDGNVLKEFIYKQNRHCNYYDEENGLAESWSSLDSATSKQGLVSTDGRTVLDPLYHYVGKTKHGLTLVADGFDYFSIIDNNGNALIYAPFRTGSRSSEPYYYCGYSGFVAIPYEEKGKDVVYIYDFSKCLGSVSEVELPSEDILFGEYNSYLNNNFYNSMAENVTTAIVDAVAAKSSHPAKVTAWAKSMLSGGLEYSVKQLFKWVPTSSLSEEKMSQEIALEYLETLEASQIESFVEETKEEYEFAKKIDGYYKQIKNLDSEINKLKFSNLWVSDKFSKDQVYELVTEAEKKADVLKAAGKGMTVAEYVMSYMMLRTIESKVIERLMILVPSESYLYKGLEYIDFQQRSKYVAVFAAEYLTDEMIGEIADFAGESLVSAFTSKSPSLVLFIIETSLKLIATQIDSPTLEEIDNAIIALANILTLKESVDDYRALIKRNYEVTGLLTTEQMKFDYSALVQTYFKSIKVGLDYAKAIADEDKASYYDELKNKYELKLLYRSYINTCLVNATAMWEYTVEANKAVLNKLKARFPKGEGRLPLYDLVFSDKYNVNNIFGTVSPSYQYAIDIPSELDGYEVSAVNAGLVTGESKLNGVYVPDSVESIDGETFDNCTGLDTVIAGNNTVIPDNSFTEDTVSVREKEVAEVKISTAANVTEMNMQDDIDDTGLSLEVTYVDGTTEVVNEGFSCVIENRVNGQNTVVVNYNGVTTEYPVNIRESDCRYTIKYVDEYGNVLKETVVGTAKSGSTLTVNAESIGGYTALNNELSEVIGYENDFVITYEKIKASSISEAVVEVADAEFTGSALTPEIKVTVDGKILEEGTDYTVVYENNIMSGTAYAIIYGCGEYAGASYGEFEITGGPGFGDTNEDGNINAGDALLVLQSAAKLKELTEMQTLAGDVNGDKMLNASDALLILQYAAKLINSFPVQK